MMTAQVLAWMTAIQGMLTVAPDVIALAAKVKQWITDLFTTGVITAEVQNELHARVNEICRATLNGEMPDHWQVEPDPEPTPDQPQAPV